MGWLRYVKAHAGPILFGAGVMLVVAIGTLGGACLTLHSARDIARAPASYDAQRGAAARTVVDQGRAWGRQFIEA
jgi:hypothetical protein